MLQPPGRAFKSALGSINGARCYIAAMCNGMVGEALRTALAYGRERHSFGQPLAEHQGWRWRLAEAGAELAAARLLVAQAAAQVESGADAQLLSAQAKLVEHAAGRAPAAVPGPGHGRRRACGANTASAGIWPARVWRPSSTAPARCCSSASRPCRAWWLADPPPGKPRGMKQGFRT